MDFFLSKSFHCFKSFFLSFFNIVDHLLTSYFIRTLSNVKLARADNRNYLKNKCFYLLLYDESADFFMDKHGIYNAPLQKKTPAANKGLCFTLSFDSNCTFDCHKWILFIDIVIKHDAIEVIDFMLKTNSSKSF